MIQEILVRYFGAQYESGSLNHPTLAKERRTLVLTQAYREASREFDSGLDTVLKLATLIGDPTLSNGVKSCLDVLRDVHVSKLINCDASSGTC